VIDEQSKQIQTQWGCSIIHLSELYKFRDAFGVELQLWKIKNVSRVLEADNVVSARSDNYIDIVVADTWTDEVEFILADDIRVCFDKSYFKAFSCTKEDCNYRSKRRTNMSDHEQRHDTERMNFKCRQFGKEESTISLLKDIVPPGYNCNNVCMFDIETLMDKSHAGLMMHVPVMIALQNNFTEDNEHVICRFDMSGGGLKTLISEFLDTITAWAEKHKHTVPMSVIAFLENAQTQIIMNKHMSVSLKNWYMKRINAIENLMEFKIMGFNSQSYDTLALSTPLIDLAMERFGAASVTCVKKGSGYFNLSIKTGLTVLSFRDVLSYLPNQSLDTFAQTWGVNMSKMVWPYEVYTSLEQIKNIKDFPDYDLFKGTIAKKKHDVCFVNELRELLFEENKRGVFTLGRLFNFMSLVIELPESVLACVELPNDVDLLAVIEERLHTSPITYVESLMAFITQMASGAFSSLLDYFILYNQIDVDILMQAWTNLVKMFYDSFGQNILQSWSLPGVAQNILLSKYDYDTPPVYTFGPKYGFLNKDVRQNIVGGFSGPISLR